MGSQFGCSLFVGDDAHIVPNRRIIWLYQLAVQMKTGIEQALISKFESGERTPPTETLMLLADFYNVSMDYIMGRTYNPKINR